MYWSLYIALFLENRFLRQHYQVKRSMSFCLDIPGLSPKKLQQFSLPTMYASMFTQTLTSTQYYLLFKIFPIKSQHLSIYLPAIWNFSSVSYMFKSFALPHPPPRPQQAHSRDIQLLFIMEQQIFFLALLSQDFAVNFGFYNSYLSAKVKAGYFPQWLLGFLPYLGRALSP